MRVREISAFYTTWLAASAISRPLQYIQTFLPAGRDLLGLLGDVEGLSTATTEPGGALTGLFTSSITNALTESAKASSIITTISTISTSSLMPTMTRSVQMSPENTLPLTTLRPNSASTPYPDPAKVTFSSVPYNIGYTSEAPSTPPGELTEWKVIGIAVITITFIATAILSVSFFDSWWGFVCAAVCGKRRKGSGRGLAGETLVPDWEKRSWEFRLANEDGHRYPTLSSLESIVKEKERAQELGGRREYDIKSPEMAYGAP